MAQVTYEEPRLQSLEREKVEWLMMIDHFIGLNNKEEIKECRRYLAATKKMIHKEKAANK